jgi:hypothetical protein
LEKVNEHFLSRLKTGDRVFKYKKLHPDEADNYILYSVVEIDKNGEVELMNIFDKEEKTKKINTGDMLKDGCWWFNPVFEDNEKKKIPE